MGIPMDIIRSERVAAEVVRRLSLTADPALRRAWEDSQAAAARARTEIAQLLKSGLEAFSQGDDVKAVQALETVRRLAPGEPCPASRHVG